MLLLFVLASVFCSCTQLALAASVYRQGYSNGTATLGGCTGVSPNDNSTYVLGSCTAGNNASVWVNDCWNNGLGSATVYIGDTTCSPSFASSVFIFGTTQPGHQVPYCNLGGTSPNITYDTFTCTDYSTPQITTTVNATITQYITITNYAMPTANNCSGSSTTLNVTVGQCSPIGNDTYIIANCGSGMVTASLYNTSDCSIQFDNTGAINVNVSAFGPYAQMGALSATGKAIGEAGSDCAATNTAYLQFQCFPTTATLPTTPITQQTSSSSSSSSSSTAAASSSSSSSSTSSSASPSSSSSSSASFLSSSSSSSSSKSSSSTGGTTGSGSNVSSTLTGTGGGGSTGTGVGIGNGTTAPPTNKPSEASHVAANSWIWIWGMLALGISMLDKYL